MRFFLKHLLNSIKLRPLQPFILILTMLLSMLVNVSAFSIGELLNEEMRLNQIAQYGSADITINLNGTSKSRFMFCERANEILGDNAKVAGSFELPLYLDESEKPVFGTAVNFSEIGNVFELEFSEYGVVEQSNINQIAFVSRSFAKEQNLYLGDRFTVNELGYYKTYTVEAISETAFFSSYDVMVNITGVIRLLAKDSLFVSALGDDFQPSSTIYIDVSDGVSVQSCIELLKQDNNFAEKSFTVVSNLSNIWTNTEILNVVLNIIILLISILSAAVVFCCFYIIASQRVAENAVFKMAGAKAWQLNLMQYLEIILYYVIGGVLGVICSVPLLKLVVAQTEFNYVLPRLSATSIIKSSIILLVVMLLTTTVFIYVEKLKKKPKRENKSSKLIIVILAALFLALFPGIFFVDFHIRLGWSITCGVIFLALLFCAAPLLFRWVMEKIENFKECKVRSSCTLNSASLHYSVKNVSTVKVLHNTCRLFVLLCVVVSCIIMSIISLNNYVANFKSFLNGNYAVINATSSCLQKVEGCNAVQSVYSVYFGYAFNGDDAVILLSVSDIEAVSSTLKPESLPVGNQAVLTEGYARMTGLKVNDSFSVFIDEVEYNLKVKQITKSDLDIVLFDNLHFNLPYNMLSVTAKSGVSNLELNKELTSTLALEMAAVTPLQDILTDKMQAVNIFISCGDFLISFVIVFAVLGIVDNLFESYSARKEQFALYEVCGMTKAKVNLMKFFELLIVFVFGVFFSVFAFWVSAIILNQAFLPIGFTIFLNL